MTKGQKAIALAMHYPEAEKGGRGKKSEAKIAAKLGGFSEDRLQQARKILAFSPDIARAVLAGLKLFALDSAAR